MPPPSVPLDAIPQPAMLFDTDGRIVAANAAADAHAGRPLAGFTLDELVRVFGHRRPDGTPLAPGDLPSARAGENGDRVEAPLVVTAADGRTLEVIGTASPVVDGDAVTGVLVVWRVVTGQRRAEAEARSTAIFPEENPNPVLRVDEEGRLLDSNPAGAALPGIPGVGEPLPAPLCREIRQARSERRVRQAELQHGPTTYAITVAPIRDEPYVNLYFSDVTEWKRAEVALRESEAVMRSILDRSLDALYRRDLATDRAEYYSMAIEAITGFSVEEAMAMSVDEIVARVHPDDLAAVTAGKVALPPGATGGSVEYRFLRKDGVYRWVSDRFRLVPGEDGRPRFREGIIRDITGQMRAEQALKESEERYRELVEQAGSIILRYDRDGRLTFANEFAQRFFGFSAGELLGRTAVGTITPETGSSTGRDLAGMLRAIVRSPDAYAENESENITKDGRRVWVRWANRPIVGHDGEVREFLAIGTDITDRRTAEEALAVSEEKYRHFFMHDITGDFIAAADGRVLDCNPAFARIFGFPSIEAALSSSMAETYVTPGDREALLDRVRREGMVKYDARFRRRVDGTPIHVVENILGRFDDDGTLVETQGYVIEDTERHRAEEGLRQSREWFRVMGEALPYGVWRANAHGGAEYVSQSFLDLLEMTQEEQREFGWTHRLPPDEVAPMLERWMHCIETGEDWDDEHHVLGPDGAYHAVLTRGRPVRDQHGEIVAWVGINLDIDDRKRAEEALREYAENLRRSNEDLERFAYVSSHDLQEPLRSIVSFSQLLERRYRGQLDADADEYIDFIVEGGMRMQALIQDLLAYSRVNTKRQELRPTDTEEVLAAVERNLAAPLLEGGAVLTHDPLPAVLADPLQLEQVLANLVSNAVKFRRPEVPLRIHVSARRLDGFWEFSVSDTGIGIEAEYFDRIFVIFQRLHTKETYPGTGIGLAIVKRIVDRHGGAVRVESAPGEGTTFVFTLPAA